jgi:hypothetical protein
MPVIIAAQEAEKRRITAQSQSRQIVHKTLSQKNPSPKGLEVWFKVKALSSSPSTAKKKRKKISIPFSTFIRFNCALNQTTVALQ